MNSGSDSTFEPGEPARDVAFFGKITASVTHELNNVISIIEQSAGLLDDMIAGEERGVPISVDRLKGVAASVQKQTQRGLEIIARLNRFAHSTDHSRTVFDVNEAVSNLVSLCRRFALLKKRDVEFRPAASGSTLDGNPFVLQQSIFLAFQEVLDRVGDGPPIVVENRVNADGVEVVIEFSGRADFDSARMAAIEALVGQVNGTAVTGVAGERARISLRIAHSKPGSGSSC